MYCHEDILHQPNSVVYYAQKLKFILKLRCLKREHSVPNVQVHLSFLAFTFASDAAQQTMKQEL